jgi:hypothetical protein
MKFRYAEWHVVHCYAECHYAECRYAECRGARSVDMPAGKDSTALGQCYKTLIIYKLDKKS